MKRQTNPTPKSPLLTAIGATLTAVRLIRLTDSDETATGTLLSFEIPHDDRIILAPTEEFHICIYLAPDDPIIVSSLTELDQVYDVHSHYWTLIAQTHAGPLDPALLRCLASDVFEAPVLAQVVGQKVIQLGKPMDGHDGLILLLENRCCVAITRDGCKIYAPEETTCPTKTEPSASTTKLE